LLLLLPLKFVFFIVFFLFLFILLFGFFFFLLLFLLVFVYIIFFLLLFVFGRWWVMMRLRVGVLLSPIDNGRLRRLFDSITLFRVCWCW
jgi:hypothetical protein